MYQKTVLSNNLRIVTNDMKERDSISIGIWVGAGGRYEDDKLKGAAHFLEHIVFKGTKHYSCEAIKEKIEGVGGSLNAFTSEEYTCYFAKIPAKHLERTFDVLSDMVYQPLISKKDVDKERGVILEEIKMYHDLPQHFVLDILDSLMWPNHPLGKSIIGSFDTISKMSFNDLRKFHQEYYFPGNVVVAATGHLNHEHLVSVVRKKSAKYKAFGEVDCKEAENSQEKSKVKFFKKDIEQMHLALGIFGLENDHKDRHAFQFLNIILGANMSSRLFDEVREKRGLAYAISSSTKFLRDTGLFLIRAGVDNKKLVKAIDVILKQVKKITYEEVLKDEFIRARDYYMGQLLLGLEDTLEHMFWIGESTVALNKIRSLNDILKEVEKVTIADIKRVAQGCFKESQMNLALVGPITAEQEKSISNLMEAR